MRARQQVLMLLWGLTGANFKPCTELQGCWNVDYSSFAPFHTVCKAWTLSWHLVHAEAPCMLPDVGAGYSQRLTQRSRHRSR
jgi:hypothetical protein